MPTNKLTHLAVTNLVKTGKKARTGDGGGLWLDVRSPGRGAWVFRYARNGASREIGLGGCGDVSLVDVRQLAAEYRSLIAKGIDPLAQREVEAIARKVEEEAKRAADNADKHTFKFAADKRIAAQGAQYRNAKHRQQWANTLATYVYPVFGDTPVIEITSDDVLRALQPIWLTKPETATRVRQRIEVVLDYAAAKKWRSGPNPALWRGNLSYLLPATNKTSRVRHHPALPWARLPEMMVALKQVPGMGALALRFAILTAARSGEVRGARWGEIDFDGGVWTVPASRMKAGRQHRVPLSSEALNVLAQARPYRQSDEKNALVFPGIKEGKRLSDMTLGAVIKRLNSRGTPTWVDAFGVPVVPHGFRSSFKDWSADTRPEPSEVVEQSLAHTIATATERAYRRSDLFERRVQLMDAWATYCSEDAAGPVVAIRRAARQG